MPAMNTVCCIDKKFKGLKLNLADEWTNRQRNSKQRNNIFRSFDLRQATYERLAYLSLQKHFLARDPEVCICSDIVLVDCSVFLQRWPSVPGTTEQ